MANTEGMPDDFVASLMTTTTTTKSRNNNNNDDDNNNNDTSPVRQGVPDIVERSPQQAVQRRQRRRKGTPIMSAVANQRLQERMNAPMPSQPAATVIRSSSRSTTAITQQQQSQPQSQPQRIATSQIVDPNKSSSSNTTESQPQSSPGMLPQSMVGNIVEHSVSDRKTSRFSRKQRKSRFAQQAKASQNGNLGSGRAGFPSVHMPIGTFVSSGSSSNNKPKPHTRFRKPTNGHKSTPATPTIDSPNSQQQQQATQVQKPQSEQERMQQASATDATNMLAQMSLEEIQSHQRDLEAALSPEMKAFLKARSQQKENMKKNKLSITTAVKSSGEKLKEDSGGMVTMRATTTSSASNIDNTSISTGPPKDSHQEKERLAKLMSSVRTHQDLDRAYHQEMQQAHPLEHEIPPSQVGQRKEEDTNITNQHHHQQQQQPDEFVMACDLLRSSVKRQTLWAARVVSQTLSQQVRELRDENMNGEFSLQQTTTSTKTEKAKKTWPLLLPISLRCLLDEPVQTHGLLHTYVLQALYNLLLLNAVDEHLIWVDCTNSSSGIGGDTAAISTIHDGSNGLWSAKDIYQHHFMDDGIPTPPLDTAYPSNNIQPMPVDIGANKSTAAAYSTSSSSTSAMEDAKAFERDPMWALLSKMRIIPRLSQLLCPKTNNNDKNINEAMMLPEEAWVASCGILAMLAQRSPGAASAIVHQKIMFAQILDRCLMRYSLERQQPEHHPEEQTLLQHVAFASLQLMLTLARQSRVTAKAMVPHMEEILPPLLLPSDNLSPLELRLQKMGIVLWRTLLRYGLGLAGFATMLKMASHHWALPHSNPSSLSIEYLSAFSQILDCARVAQGKASKSPAKAKQKVVIHETSMGILSMIPTHLAATHKQLLSITSLSPVNNSETSPQQANDNCHEYRWKAARLGFLSCYWSLSANASSQMSTTSQEVKIEEVSMEDELSFLETLDVWTDPEGDVESAWKVVWPQVSDEDDNPTVDLTEEAAACAFLSAFANTLVAVDMSKNDQKNRMAQELSKAVVKHFVERMLEGFQRTNASTKNQQSLLSLPRKGWMNQCYFAIAKLLFHAHSIGILTSSSDVNQARMLVFSLLGNLERGQESVAAVLFSQDVLFMPSANPLYDAALSSSPISSLFLGEICGSEMARKQLDHSFKLQHGFGLTAEGYGPFQLDSLLSATDRLGPKTNGELILPLGNLWLLQTLSGSIQMKQETVDKGTSEAARVVSTALGLLLELEEAGEIDAACRWYSPSIPVGAKMYYLLNVCLHPESVLRDERIAEASGALFERYCDQLDQSSLLELSKACLEHTEPTKRDIRDTGGDDGDDDDDNDKANEKEKAIIDSILNSNIKTEIDLSPAEMRSLEALLEDIVSAYRDYGAQYSFFTKCMRLFLSPIYPPSIRCRAMRELRGMLHLLTLPDDSKSDEALLEGFLSGGLPDSDGSAKDASSVLDAIAVAVSKESSGRRLDGFFLQFSVATLARNLAGSMFDETSCLTMKRRLNQIPNHVASQVCDVTSALLKGDGSKQHLAGIAAKVCTSTNAVDNFDLDTSISNILNEQKK